MISSSYPKSSDYIIAIKSQASANLCFREYSLINATESLIATYAKRCEAYLPEHFFLRLGNLVFLLMAVVLGYTPLMAQSSNQRNLLSYQDITTGKKETELKIHESDLVRLKYASKPQAVSLVSLPKDNSSSASRSAIIHGILFTFKSYTAKEVAIAGNFSQWQKNSLKRNDQGIWYLVLPYPKGYNPILYRFSVDDLWIANPLGSREYIPDMAGEVSVVHFSQKHHDIKVFSKMQNNGLVLFQIAAPNAQNVTISGDFNNWLLWHDFLQKNADGIWQIEMNLAPGDYLYRFYIDGKWHLDKYNPHTRLDSSGELSSVIKVPPSAKALP